MGQWRNTDSSLRRGEASAWIASLPLCPISELTALLFLDRPDLAGAVVAAIGTDAMRQLELVALRALAHSDRLERVVCAALGRTGL